MPQFNRIITIEKPVIIRDNFGSEVTTWATHSQVWAEKRETKSDEKFVPGSNVTVATRATTWRTWFDPELNELMRVVDDEKLVWNIIGLAVVDFNRAHDLIAQSSGERA